MNNVIFYLTLKNLFSLSIFEVQFILLNTDLIKVLCFMISVYNKATSSPAILILMNFSFASLNSPYYKQKLQ
jgi:hypothetical protein